MCEPGIYCDSRRSIRSSRISRTCQNLLIRTGAGPTVFLRDFGTIEDSSDSYAEVNGRRTVYIPVTKRADASTLAVVIDG
jgi:multidrug efflux pump subunit AcrB